MLRRVIEADQLPEYAIEWAQTGEGKTAVTFRLRGEAAALARQTRLEADRERRQRVAAEGRRVREVDDLMDQLAKGGGR